MAGGKKKTTSCENMEYQRETWQRFVGLQILKLNQANQQGSDVMFMDRGNRLQKKVNSLIKVKREGPITLFCSFAFNLSYTFIISYISHYIII